MHAMLFLMPEILGNDTLFVSLGHLDPEICRFLLLGGALGRYFKKRVISKCSSPDLKRRPGQIYSKMVPEHKTIVVWRFRKNGHETLHFDPTISSFRILSELSLNRGACVPTLKCLVLVVISDAHFD